VVVLNPRTMPADTPNSEQPIFEALAAAKGADDWKVFHSVELNDIDGELHGEVDFVVVIPKRGIVAIEAKGPKGFKSDDNGLRLIGVPNEDADPIEQLETERWSLINYVTKHVGFRPLVARVLWITSLNAKEMSKHQGDASHAYWEVLNKDHLDDVIGSISEVLERNHESPAVQKEFGPQIQLQGELMKNVCDAIRQSFSIRGGKQTLASWMANELDRTKFGLVDISTLLGKNPHIYFEGAAGTGKSGYIRRFLMDAADINDKKCLLASWGKMLAEDGKEEFGSAYDGRVVISDIGELMTEIAGPIDPEIVKAKNFYSEILPEIAKSKVKDSKIGGFDIVAVDEFQDIAGLPKVIEFLEALTKSGSWQTSALLLACDPRQQIMRQRNAPKVESPWHDARKLVPDLVHVSLTANYRNAPEVGKFVSNFMQERFLYDSFFLQEGKGSIKVVEISAGTSVRALMNSISELREEFRDDQIRVLSPFNKGSIAKNIVEGRNEGSDHPDQKTLRELLKIEDREGGSIECRSIQKFKGRESHAVVITDMTAWHIQNEYKVDPEVGIHQLFEQLYVALSRANYHATILCDSYVAAKIRERKF